MQTNKSFNPLILSPRFARLCLCTVLFFASFNMIIPELPEYLRSMGGGKYIGYIIALFTVTAAISRPYSGKWADQLGRVPVMVIGSLVSAVCGLLYIWVPGILSFLALRLFHGFSTGFTPTGSTAYVADIVPATRRGEAMGIVGLSGSLGMAAGPAIGSWLCAQYGFNTMFAASGILGFVAFGLIAGMKETLANPQKFNSKMFEVNWSEVYENRVWAPTLVLMLCVLSFGTAITLIPDLTISLGIQNKGIFFSIFTIASMSVRFGAGKISDRLGREKVLLVSTMLLGTAMLCLGLATQASLFYVGSVLFGLAQGINSPTVMAWAIDRSSRKNIGRAMATVYIGMEIGIGLGAFVSGFLFSSTSAGFMPIFVGTAFFSFLAFFFLLYRLYFQIR